MGLKKTGGFCAREGKWFSGQQTKTLELSFKDPPCNLKEPMMRQERDLSVTGRSCTGSRKSPPASRLWCLMSLYGKTPANGRTGHSRERQGRGDPCSLCKETAGSKDAYDEAIDPNGLEGIYAGNPETLSLRACFPRSDDILEVRYACKTDRGE